MNQRGFASVILIIGIVIAVIAGYFLVVKQQDKNNPQAPTNTAKWQTYNNEKYHFTLQIPENLIAITQNDNSVLSDFLFIGRDDLKKLEKDSLFKTNPLVVALSHDIASLQLSRNASSWVAKIKETDIKSYLSSSVGGPRGDVKVTLKDFTQITTINGQVIYSYTQELKTTPLTQDIGVLWVSRGVMYTLTNLSEGTSSSKETLLSIAESFTELINPSRP